MKLFTSLPARRDGTLHVTLRDGTKYTFTGTPLTSEVEDEDHADELRDSPNFQTQDEFEAEQAFQKQASERAARRAAREGGRGNAGTFTPGAENEPDDDVVDTGNGLPQESNTPPTGRVRKASRASNVTG